jgi:hypothetical protein
MGEGGEQIDVVCTVQWFVSGGVGGQQQRWHAVYDVWWGAKRVCTERSFTSRISAALVQGGGEWVSVVSCHVVSCRVK